VVNGGNVINPQKFLLAAHECGFIEVNESLDGTVLWLRKKTPDTDEETDQCMCIDTMTESATIYWIILPKTLNSKNFRTVAALKEWLESRPEIPVL
jgi:uncharacterized protein YqcC (DUF446 family)